MKISGNIALMLPIHLQHCCLIAELHRQRACWYEGINPIIVLTCCPCLGNGMADFVPGERFGVK